MGSTGGTALGADLFLAKAPEPAMRAWLAALANRDAAPAKIVVLGDSVVEGTGATARPGRRWVDLFLSRLRAKYPTAGIGTGGGVGYLPLFYAGGTLSPWTRFGGASQNLTNGLGGRALVQDAAGKLATITVTGTSLDLHYLKAATSRILYTKVDGGSAVTFDTNAGAVADNGIRSISLGASGAHTFEVGYSSGGGCFPEGIFVYDGDEAKGIHLYEAGHSGYETGDFAASPLMTNQSARIAAIAPALVVIGLGENDYLHGRPVAAVKPNLQALIASIRSAITGVKPSFLIVANYNADAGGANIAAWSDYVAQLRSAAAADTGGPGGVSGVAFADLSARMPAVSGDVLSLYSDTFHPSDKGYSMVGDALVSVVSPR